jgi:hypothetical protein
MPAMNSLIGKRQEVQALAVTLENGCDIATRETKNIKYFRDPRSYYGKEITYEIAVHVEPPNEPPFEAKMKTPHTKVYLLSTGVRVQIKYYPKNKQKVTFDDDPHDIKARNPQLEQFPVACTPLGSRAFTRSS